MKELLLLSFSGPEAVFNYIALGAMFMSGGYIAYFVYKRATDQVPNKVVTEATAQESSEKEIQHLPTVKTPGKESLPEQQESSQPASFSAEPESQTKKESVQPQPTGTNDVTPVSQGKPLPTPAASDVPEDPNEFSNIPVSTLTQLYSFSNKQADAIIQNNENQYDGNIADEIEVDLIINDDIMHTLVTSDVDTTGEAEAWKGEDQNTADDTINEKASEDNATYKEIFMPVHELFESMEKVQNLMTEVSSFIESYKEKALASQTEEAQKELINATEDAYQYMILELKDKKMFHIFGAEVKELHKDLRETPFFELDPSDSLLFTKLMKA